MEEIKKSFGNDNLYEILGVSHDATFAQIKKGYLKSALKYVSYWNLS